jgi:Outer membrane protein beta-barrel domain
MKSAWLIAALATLLGSDAYAGDDPVYDRFFFGPTLGTLGTGVEAGYRIDDNWRVRADIAGLRGSLLYKANRADVDANIKLLSGGLTFDYFPTAGNLYVSGGARLSASRISGSLKNLSATAHVAGHRFDIFMADPLTDFSVRQNAIQPYIGVGYAVPLTARTSLNIDFGALYAGSPDLSVNSRATRFGFTQHQIDREIQHQQNRLNPFKFLPVAQVGLKFSF